HFVPEDGGGGASRRFPPWALGGRAVFPLRGGRPGARVSRAFAHELSRGEDLFRDRDVGRGASPPAFERRFPRGCLGVAAPFFGAGRRGSPAGEPALDLPSHGGPAHDRTLHLRAGAL